MRLWKFNQKTRFTDFTQVQARHLSEFSYIHTQGREQHRRTECLSLRRQWLCHVHGGGLHRPPLLVGLQQAVQLLQVSHNVVLDVRSRDLEPHTAAVKGAREVTGKHLIYHPSHNRDDLLKKSIISA